MKPNFALTLSFEGIGLLHRTFPGWHLVGEVRLDVADLGGELAALRGKALALDPSGLTAKLVVPNDQIRYLDFDATGLTEDGFADAARAALEGATPYAVDDLAFDWSVGSGRVFVAAVARETLHEAENFAVDHGFNPISYVATPEATAFVGEPFFGESRFAAGHLGDDVQVERDPAAIRVIGAARLPQPDALPDPLDDDDAQAVPAPEVAAPEAGDAPPAPAPVPEAPAAESPAPAAPLAAAPELEPPEPTPPEPEKSEAAVTFASIRVRRDDAPVAKPRLAGATRTETPPPPPAPASKPDHRVEPPAPAPLPPAPSQEAPVFVAPEPADLLDDAALEDQAALISATLIGDDPEPFRFDPDVDADPDFDPAPDFDTPEPAPATSPGLADRVSFFTRRVKDRRRAAREATATAHDARVPTPHDEKQRMTVFGARETGAPRRPRYFALILTAVLLLFLVGVAAWASIFLDDGLARFFRGAESTRIAAVPDDAAGTLPDLADAVDDQMAEDIVIASLPQTGIDVETIPRVTLSDAQPAELTPDEARARYAATGIWQLAPVVPRPPGATNLEEFYQTSIDPAVTIQDAIALPGTGQHFNDTAFEAPSDPPPAGVTFRHDDRGFILATPEGTMTPDGVLVIAGRPPLVPPRAANRSGTPQDTVAEAEAVAAAPAIASIRPRLRPADLAEQNERGQLAGRTLAELASIRPRLRPKSAQQAAEEAAIAAAVAAAQAAEDITPEDTVETAASAAAGATIAFSSATPQAVAASLKPKKRPRDFAAVVKKSQRETAAQPVSATQRVAPKIPTTASVARAATEKDKIKLRKVNLIGVYGKPQSRRALVRLANGRYKKVKVGDRLDGGKVAAIGSSDLRYIKSGRSVILKMPKG